MGPPKGDALFDNLVPVSLMWGNDPKVIDTNITESWINPDLRNVMYGWAKRPSLGFNGRANGPADNIRSSCLSCHAAARTPRSKKGILDTEFDMDKGIKDPDKVRAHVDVWFINLKAGDLFDPAQPAVSALDYSLQLEQAIVRMCRACRSGALSGNTPPVCRDANLFREPKCGPSKKVLETSVAIDPNTIDDEPPPRQ